MTAAMPRPHPPAEFDDDAWRELTARLGRLARALARGPGRASAPDDLVQETLVRVLSAGRSPMDYAYARTTLIRAHLDAERSARRRLKRHLVWALTRPHTHRPAPGADSDEAVRAARRALDRLPAMQRAAFVLRVVDGMSYAHIAAALGTTESAAGSSVHAARRRLAGRLDRRSHP
ncbi:MAG: RNA polymerase sigma factor [Planctomycetota bacterium]|nr:MAG: RNA polymerase sigma factor [Planctomycetota bacterium]